MSDLDDAKKKFAEEQRQLEELKRRQQNEELKRIQEQRRSDQQAIEKGEKARPTDERPSEDD